MHFSDTTLAKEGWFDQIRREASRYQGAKTHKISQNFCHRRDRPTLRN